MKNGIKIYKQRLIIVCIGYLTVFGEVTKSKQYNGITVKSWTNIKSVKIILNIFAVFLCAFFHQAEQELSEVYCRL